MKLVSKWIDIIVAIITVGIPSLTGFLTYAMKSKQRHFDNERQILKDVADDRNYWKTTAQKLQHDNEKLYEELQKVKNK